MKCSKVREVVFLYTDNEMEEELLVAFREHLVVCPECARRLDYTRRVLTVLRSRCSRARAPERLRRRILTSRPQRREDV